jgi:hypothetical protein
MMPLHTETSVGTGGRMTCSADWYIITISLIRESTCSIRHSFVQNVTRKCCATRMGVVIFPVIVRSLQCMMSRVTLVFTMVPSPSHGPFPCPGHQAKFDPHHLQSFVILRSLRPEVEILFRVEIRWIVSSVLPLLFNSILFLTSPPPEQRCLRFLLELWPARASSFPAAHLVYLDPL